ncbi:hypothetical protein QBC33DRAFT_459211 [Phialemonium atrogriseum]|uniref:BTB domain-containing protein n=1 Tax=Phialemonium atrogriseum TaxID=1093897 RepID=A0AAJ0BUD2_9PEZI|nr:uncharacterized protein QBC33DRAFT_459211 [Phialemonium atrogriseum]KAK1763563.1 hypothetical protein QBC33DRAFT_459211 [Phialemonium atrogriseum]
MTRHHHHHHQQVRELRDLTRLVRTALDAAGEEDHDDDDGVDAAFARLRGRCGVLCGELLGRRGGRGIRGHGRTASAVSGAEVGGVAAAVVIDRARRRSVAVPAGGGVEGSEGVCDGVAGVADVDGASLEAVGEWRACLEELAVAHKSSLAKTYRRFEHFAAPEILDALFAERRSRAQIVGGWMKNFGAYKRMDAEVRSKWESQFRQYEEIVCELRKITELVQPSGSGISPDRTIRKCIIAPRGDTILEFANASMPWEPVLRFKVSSHMLAETSPIFARMFSPHAEELDEDGEAEELAGDLPPPPTPFDCEGGRRVLLYRMPQLELNERSSLSILLHAAHMHNDRVPREVPFEQFVALAETSLRYRCTSPLELFVEHRWLPQWVHKATEDMPEGLLVISYAFGLRRLFTRLTKTAILNLVDERELAGKKWPARVKERIWAVRCAKMAQVYDACARAVVEYLRTPERAGGAGGGGRAVDDDEGGEGGETAPPILRTTSIAPSLNLFATTTTSTPCPGPRIFNTPRCAKGNHWCDATNLGWLMLVYNELDLLPAILHPSLSPSQTDSPTTARSLAQLVDALRGVTGPPNNNANLNSNNNPAGGGRGCGCGSDPAPALRVAASDVYNGVSGLTLFEVDGRRHGWALSRHRRDEPQAVFPDDTTMPPPASAVERVLADESLWSRILGALDGTDYLHASAAVNGGHVRNRKNHELRRCLARDDDSSGAATAAGDRDPADDGGSPSSSPPRLENRLLRLIVGRDAGRSTMRTTRERRGAGANRAGDDGGPEGGYSSGEEGTQGLPPPQLGSPAAPPYRKLAGDAAAARGATSPMTEEEAFRILWPPEPAPPELRELSVPDVPAVQPDGLAGLDLDGSKCQANEIVRIEDKTLLVVGNKQLRGDLDRRIGLIS